LIATLTTSKYSSDKCPVKHLSKWLDISGISDGPVFRRIRRNQKLGEELLTVDGFYKLLKKLCTEAGIESKQISPHSLRAGFITSAYMAGKVHISTRQISGHRHHETYERYICNADRYKNNAADLF